MKASIDRFEGDTAVLVGEGVEERLPRSALPPDAHEGDLVDLDTLTIDREGTQQLRDEVSSARAGLKRERNPGAL